MHGFRLWRLTVAAALAAAFAVCGARPALAYPAVYVPSAEDSVLLQLQVKKYRMGNELRGYQTPAGVCVDLADVIQALDLPIRLDKKSRRATGWIFSEVQAFSLDREARTVQIMNKVRPLQGEEVIDAPEGWCVSTQTMSGWFGVTLTADLRNSLLLLDSDKPLPFLQAIERQGRAARLVPDRNKDLASYPQARQDYALWRLPAVDVVARANYRTAGTSHGQLNTQYEVLASGELARASYNLRVASDFKGAPASVRFKTYRIDPDARLLGPLKATQVAAGDVEVLPGNLAGNSGVGRGAFLSNRPVQRATNFGSTVIRGILPIGWDAELYRNGQLLAYQGESKDGRYEFDVRLVYGQNDLEVVLYGPQGQVRRETQSIAIGYGAVAPGKLEYWAGVVDSGKDLLRLGPAETIAPTDSGWHYAGGVQYGIDQRTVVGASGHSLMMSGRRRDYGEVTLQRSIGKFLLGTSAAQEFTSGARAYQASLIGRLGRFNVQAESHFTTGNFVSGVVNTNERSAQRVEFDTVFRAGRWVMPVSGGVRRTQTRAGDVATEVLARAGLVTPFAAVSAYIIDRRTDGFSHADDGLTLGLLGNTRIAGVSVRGEAAYQVSGVRRGLSSASVTLDKPLGPRSDLRLDIEHTPRSGQTSFELGYVRQFRRLALTASARGDTRGSLGAGLSVSFSLGRDPLAGRWRLSSDKLAQRGEAAVSVFLDEDGDGRRSADEKALPGVGITAGQHGSAEPTDKRGQAFVEGLQPYEKVLVSVDESTLPDPFLVARGKGLVITPRPGVPAVLELAVSPTGEVEGQLNTADGVPAAGVELELVGVDGTVVGRTRSEYDGYVLFDKVTYGQYRLRVSAGSERAVGRQGELARGIVVNGKATLAKVGTMRLRPPTTIASAARP